LIVANYLLPVDVQFTWLSMQGLTIMALIAGAWLVPGFVLGGWKALLVAVGRSGVTTGTDKALMVVFALWAVGWPLFVVLSLVQHGVI
jgi:hypothetical protein